VTVTLLALATLASHVAAGAQTHSPSLGAAVADEAKVATDWAQFHFDSGRSGFNPGEHELSPSTVGNLEMQWAFSGRAEMIGSPVVVSGVVYAGDMSGTLYAVDAATGNQLWTRAGLGTCAGDPQVAGGRIYVPTCLGNSVVALDAATGQPQWTQVTGGGVFRAPAVADGLVYASSNDGRLYAWDAVTGASRWKVETGSSSEVVTVSGGLVYLGGANVDFQAFDALTGDLAWSTRLRGYGAGAAVVDGVLYVGTNTGIPYKFYALDAATGVPLWSRTIHDSVIAHGVLDTPAVANGMVYVGAQDGNLYAMRAATGKLRWIFHGEEGGFFLSAPVIANGVVYVGKESLLAIDARTGSELWSFQPGDLINEAAAVTGGVVYVGSFDHNLYAFGLP
jgi:outer membrane protein assembly factor BamB